MAENVFLFVPNLIGFVRIIIALPSFYYMPTSPVIAAGLYLLSGFLDAFDGHAARLLDQGTKFGAMLDMLTDRCGTMCLLIALGHLYPQYMFLFQLSCVIDISCHWIHVHTTSLIGRVSHKIMDDNVNPLLRIYYSSRAVLFLMCAANELFYASLYLLYFYEGVQVFGGLGVWRALVYLLLPVAVLKSIVALMQGYYAALGLAELDVKDREEEKRKVM